VGVLIAVLLVAACDQNETPVPRRDLAPLALARQRAATRAPEGGAASCDRKQRFYRDQDGDGHGDPGQAVEACAAPRGYVARAGDCYDGNAAARPGQTESFAVHRGDGSFDYDCDGQETRRFTTKAYCRLKDRGGCALASGWEGKGPVPRCGEPGEFSWKHCRESVVVKAPEAMTEDGRAPPAHSEGALVPGARQSTFYECGGRTLPWKKRQLCR
jgi:hypothetical protein